jgi:hypothetical protein
MTLFWLHDDKQLFRTQVDEQYDPLQQFETKGNKIQGQLADLLEELPPAYAELVSNGETAWLSQKVRRSFSNRFHVPYLKRPVSRCHDDTAL